MPLKLFKIEFKGSWLGGKAIVAACTYIQAYHTLQAEYPRLESILSSTLRIEEVPALTEPTVVFMDDGEY
ncbi:MAG: hypothetical protein GY934_09790 [Gammaproteobacteria bacterium]|nr:hypothetical protein [Gammaproteobacteria bacterium]